MRQTNTGGVAEVSAKDAVKMLQENPAAQLIDVRTRAEWAFVGAPTLPFRAEGPIFIEWQAFPEMKVDADFARRLEQELARRGVASDAPLLFLCRSGARSRSAAGEMAKTGRSGPCLNVTEGFEGPLDEEGRRGRCEGWKAFGLPWRQS